MSRGIPVALAMAMAVAAATDVSAHRREDYLQAARISLEPDRAVITLDVTPGMAVAESFVAALDQDRDGSLSSEEQQRYTGQVMSALNVAIDGKPLRPGVLSSSFPEPSAFRRGEGTIRLNVHAALPALPAGPHRLLFRNAHLAGHSAYLANALVPESPRVAVTAQRRDRVQSELTIEYVVQADPPGAQARTPVSQADLDKMVQAFLESRRGTWHDLNVPESDGRVLHDLIVKHTFTRALEIGTSTGHSGIWIAWALAKTGGKLTTIEIDPGRHRTALANFKEAGLAPYIDARLGDAHEIVPALPGPFDFVFSDADKDWYKNYFVAAWPRVVAGGCFTAHNVSGRRAGGIDEFLSHVNSLPDGVTTIDQSSRAGISITCKR